MRNITISIDEETWKIYKKLPDQERSAIIRTLIKTLDPKTGEEKPEKTDTMLKKLLTLEPCKEQPPKKGDSSGHTNLSYVQAPTTDKSKPTYSRPCMTQTNDSKLYSSSNYENGSPFA